MKEQNGLNELTCGAVAAPQNKPEDHPVISRLVEEWQSMPYDDRPARVKEAIDLGYSRRDIAKRVHCDERTIRNDLKRWKPKIQSPPPPAPATPRQVEAHTLFLALVLIWFFKRKAPYPSSQFLEVVSSRQHWPTLRHRHQMRTMQNPTVILSAPEVVALFHKLRRGMPKSTYGPDVLNDCVDLFFRFFKLLAADLRVLDRALGMIAPIFDGDPLSSRRKWAEAGIRARARLLR